MKLNNFLQLSYFQEYKNTTMCTKLLSRFAYISCWKKQNFFVQAWPNNGKKFSSQSANLKQNNLCHKLTQRGLIRASGKDTSNFLQGLITNDMGCLDVKCDIRSMFAMLLNVQGRILYDMIVYKIDQPENPTYFIECDRDVIPELMATIKKYKIRKKVDIADVSLEYNVWSLTNDSLSESGSFQPSICNDQEKSVTVMCVDPRVKSFGNRMILPVNDCGTQVIENCAKAKSLDEYHLRRYRFGLAEGIIDMPPGNSLPLESNAVFMHGVSFDKGCYIGQELTARSHHTGVIRKRLMPIQIHSENHNFQPGDKVENTKNKNCGKYRNSVDGYGLALLRVADVLGYELSVKNVEDQVVGNISTWIPRWWPRDSDEVIKKALSQLNNEKNKMTDEQ